MANDLVLSTALSNNLKAQYKDLGVWIKYDIHHYKLVGASWFAFNDAVHEVRGVMTFRDEEDTPQVIEDVRGLDLFDLAFLFVMRGKVALKVIQNCTTLDTERTDSLNVDYKGDPISGWEMRSIDEVMEQGRNRLR